MRSVEIQNRSARHNYSVEDTLEAGLVLYGTEVKSIRQGKANLIDSYAVIKDGEIYIVGMHISPYDKGNIFNKDPLRDKKLLLHKKEINKLLGIVQQKGLSLIPLKVYFLRGKVKLQLAIARGKKLYDKRDDLKARDAKREIDRRLKENFK